MSRAKRHVAIIRPAVEGMSDFLHCLVLSPYFQAFIFDEQTGAGRGGLPKNRMDRIVIALPPRAEQHRIVAKVDELMALCGQLEASLTTGEATRRRLLDALLHTAFAPAELLAARARHAAASSLPAKATRVRAQPPSSQHPAAILHDNASRGRRVSQAASHAGRSSAGMARAMK